MSGISLASLGHSNAIMQALIHTKCRYYMIKTMSGDTLGCYKTGVP